MSDGWIEPALALFRRACELPPDQRGAFLEEACRGNVELRRHVDAMLVADDARDSTLDDAALPRPVRAALADLADQAQLAHSDAAALPETIAGYRILRLIAHGGMGTVYQAEQQAPVRREVALKVIKLGMDSEQVIARFERERQALARMTHPNIAYVHDAGTTASGTPYFVMEYVPGEPLTEYCDRHKLSTRARVELFLGVCDGVQHAHQKGIIHRDLKPTNVLVMQHDGHAVPKIIDFGVARATTGSLEERTLHTLVGQIVGTLDYMSPEQADPKAVDIDTRSDIYSLGVVLYELVSGLLPFDHRQIVDQPFSEVQRRIREEDPPTPSTRLRKQPGTATTLAPLHGTDERSLVRQLSGDLDWICLKALEKDPARRYSSASELAEDLRRHLRHEPVLAGRPGALYRARKFVRRHRTGVAAGTVVAAGACAGIFGIVSGRLEAAAEAAKVLRLSDAKRLQQLLESADGLWPAVPAQIPALESWLRVARELDSNLADHRKTLDERVWHLERPEDEWHHGVLSELIGGLEQLRSGLLAEDTITPDRGWSIPKRLAFARALEADFGPGARHAAAWERDLPAIRAAYPGLELSMQPGLVPIGPDPSSGLWEFAHLMTGEAAVRDDHGRLLPSAATGLVLVLIPGGSFTMGAQWRDRRGENYDQLSRYAAPGSEEEPLVRVALEPYFLSKFEMTQGQWQRSSGQNPSFAGGVPLSPLNPVNQVSWTDCDRILQRLELTLPTEEQWEYAARAGTTSVWSTGDGEASLQGFANLFDRAGERVFPGWLQGAPVAEIDDGFATIAPVGSFEANPWGLHDVHGNVLEWCSTSQRSLDTTPDGEAGPIEFRFLRGGSARQGADAARCARRQNAAVSITDPALGLRPARAIAGLPAKRP